MRRCVFLLFTWIYTALSAPCIPRDFGNNGTVCVCNATYCDSTPVTEVPDIGFYMHYTSSKDGLRFSTIDGVFNKELPADSNSFQLDFDTTFQPIHGFGGAFTDAATMNIKTLSPDAQENLMRTYFTEEGSNYHFGRVPIGSSDFSTRPYTYDDYEGDMQLEKFSLADEDLLYKIPLMKKAVELNPEIKFFAAAWSAPPWMRTDNNYTGYGFLRKEYYQVYARYHEEFLNKYEDHGLKMWAISAGNEPFYGMLSITYYNSMGWLPRDVGTWVANNLGPTICKSKHSKTLIIGYDDATSGLVSYVNETFSNGLARKYIAGIAIHGYTDTSIPANVLDGVHEDYPEKFLILTEYSNGSPDAETGILALGSWDRGEEYILDIIQNLQNWVTGWVDWNLALNIYGKPNWRGIFGDAAVIVNPESDEFYKQPKYYAIAHFSKFIPPGSIRIGLTHGMTSVKAVAFKTLKNETVVVMYNTYLTDQNVTIYDSRRGQISLKLPPKSIHTLIYY
ncbi:lysosomal acid glucosylceramidase-like [Neodiprion virginianus]|uniref:lysosomal acid glucosylceramidase-like n=1 Tax=Neodiprion virginianus TaxID=2961670 RepID=UPI001EE74828|nr:lysosomal acid glucosylceramidase-like [Neodiprion virginianus]XP_046610846.1 lysosomal acid glucosylceramidase-like [Neodiprion virginianus]XP_046610847.1 lysosomal acid glucosylceramidase-like [Neodiprion virginianus]XP_046610848.1 lysosomal acid glucosylceramidase-like [Neodiprion virginianus]